MSPSQPNQTSHPKINKLFNRHNSNGKQQRPPPSSYEPPQEALSSPQPVSPTPGNHPTSSKQITRKLSKTRITTERAPSAESTSNASDTASLLETPVIIEPVPIPSPHQRRPSSVRRSMQAERPLTMAHYDPTPSSDAGPSPSANRFADFPSRLSGWFSNSFAGPSTTDLTLPPSSLAPSSSSATVVPSSSPKPRAGGILSVAKHPARGLGGGIEKAVRYFLDTDAQPDKNPESIWLMGVKHPGYEPPSPSPGPGPMIPTSPSHRRESTDAHALLHARRSTPPTISRGSGLSYHANASLQSLNNSLLSSPNSGQSKNREVLSWPPQFYEDFTSCVWMTYRSQYVGIRDTTLAALEAHATVDGESHHRNGAEMVSSPPRKWWGAIGDRTWTSDAGWGCMLRTGQSLLAITLFRLHLGRDWRRPHVPSLTAEYATYVKLLTWFLDSPSTLCPFSVHRMALAGKDLGKDVGQWFGPSTAAGAIKTLVHAFPDSLLSVSIASDGVVFESDVYAASQLYAPLTTSRKSKWGGRAVLVLIGIRLGIDCVNPVYYDTIKEIFTWPQSVGISGGRPSSSYYFMGEQAGHLFYLDPHHTRSTVPLRQPPPTAADATPSSPATTTTSQLESTESADDARSNASRRRMSSSRATPERDNDRSSGTSSSFGAKLGRMASTGGGSIRQKHRRGTAPPSSPNARPGGGGGSGSSNASLSIQQHVSLSPSPLHQDTTQSNFTYVMPGAPGTSPSGSSFSSVVPPPTYTGSVDPLTYHYCTAYSTQELRTFHCDKVRKMSLSALDPSMLLGFVVKDDAEWQDLRRRVAENAKSRKSIFTIQDEPPSWTMSPTEADLESVSDLDPEEDQLDLELELEDPVDMAEEPPETPSAKADHASDDFFDAEEGEHVEVVHAQRRVSDSPSVQTNTTGSNASDGARRRSSTLTSSSNKGSSHEATTTDDSLHSAADDDDDDDWDSSIPSSSSPPAIVHSNSTLDKTHGKSQSLGSPIVVHGGEQPSLQPSRSSISSSRPATQYPFPSGGRTSSPDPEPLRSPPVAGAVKGGGTGTAKFSKRRTSLKGKDGGRTPSGGVLAIFNPGKDRP